MNRARFLTTLFVAGGMCQAGGCAGKKAHTRTDDATLTQADLPATVDKIFHRDHPLASIKQIDKQINDGVVRFIITYYDPDASRHQAMFDREGDILSAESADAPTAAR